MDSGYRLLAAKYIRRQAKQLAEQLDGVRAAEDIEFVHRARVATRRLRAALRMFDDCFAAQAGPAMAEGHPPHDRQAGQRPRPGRADRAALRHPLGAEREGVLSGHFPHPGATGARPRTLAAQGGQGGRPPGGQGRFARDAAGDQARSCAKAGSAAENVQTPAAYAQTRRHILRQLDELLRHQDSLADPDDRERHHAMRIAAKRLRYTLEIARPVYPGRLDEAVEAIKRVQSLLGRRSRLRRLGRASRRLRRRASASGSRRCSAMPAGWSICSPESTICGRIGGGIAQEVFRQLGGVLGRIGPAAVLGRPDERGAGRRPMRRRPPRADGRSPADAIARRGRRSARRRTRPDEQRRPRRPSKPLLTAGS